MSIRYIDRKTKQIETEKIYGYRALSFLYGDSWFSYFFSLFLSPCLSRIPLFSRFYGFLQKRKWSARKIAPFVESYGIDTSEFLEQDFNSFNDFFIRKLKPEARPILEDSSRAIMPADGRYLVYPDISQVDQFYVKGQNFDLISLLQNGAYGRRYADGSMVIARLCPTDYHRFHFVADGTPLKEEKIEGFFDSVNPIALRKRLSILWTNKRALTEFESERFGKILHLEIGAICVGTIHQTYTPEKAVKKGDEKGFFSFGGSCLILLFEKGRIAFDEDLIENTKKGLETKANFGESLGRSLS